MNGPRNDSSATTIMLRGGRGPGVGPSSNLTKKNEENLGKLYRSGEKRKVGPYVPTIINEVKLWTPCNM